jgi:hypothetical protein
MLLYLEDFETGISIFQRFIEFSRKELLLPNKEGFELMHVNDIILNVINIIDPAVRNTLNLFPVLGFSWVISFFTNNTAGLTILNTATQYRLFDYFIVSHPISVYVLVALIIVDEVRKLENEKVK